MNFYFNKTTLSFDDLANIQDLLIEEAFFTNHTNLYDFKDCTYAGIDADGDTYVSDNVSAFNEGAVEVKPTINAIAEHIRNNK